MRQRQIVLSLDGSPFATLLHGESASRDIAPGRHRLRAHNTLVWKTVEFEIAGGETIRFLTVNRAGPGTVTMICIARRRSTLRHSRTGRRTPNAVARHIRSFRLQAEVRSIRLSVASAYP